MSPATVVILLCLYQNWSGERIVDPARAKSVVDFLIRLLVKSTSKAVAVDTLLREDWCDTKACAKRLVDALWVRRDQFILDYHRSVARKIIEG